jgi:hypothetical protein
VPLVGGGNHGIFNYWNQNYQDANTQNHFLIGNTVGREGHTLLGWFTYWIAPNNTLQFSFKQNSVSPDFVPGGASWQDYAVRNEFTLHSGFYLKTQFQYEHITRYPFLFNGPQQNFTAIAEVGFYPQKKDRQ